MHIANRGYEVVYLTGAPASGKSSLCRELAKACSPLQIFEYGAMLTEHLRLRTNDLSQSGLRELSSEIVTINDVNKVDELLISNVHKGRRKSHIIIDSHAVTKESFGFRVLPFSIEKLVSLAPTRIISLYTDSATVKARINADPQGRPVISDFEAESHTFLQGSVAIAYGIHTQAPTYFVDASISRDEIISWFRENIFM